MTESRFYRYRHLSSTTLTLVLLIILDLSAFATSTGENGGSEDSHARYRRQSSCLPNEDSCDNGECILAYKMCDGAKDCSDGSDENSTACDRIKNTCTSLAFQCAYGACLDAAVRCDGAKDCLDESDEQGCFQPLSGKDDCDVRCVTGGSIPCRLPPQPQHGYYTTKDNSSTGTVVQRDFRITYTCHDSYHLSSNISEESVCKNGTWTNPLDCVKLCPALKSETVDVKCMFSGWEVSCSRSVRPKTVATAKCKKYYKSDRFTSQNQNKLLCLDTGEWSHELFSCVKDPNQKDEQSSVCILPVQARHREFCSVKCSDCSKCPLPPASVVTDETIKIQCEPGYRLDDNEDTSLMACVNGAWSSEFPQCLKVCPPLESDSILPECYYGNLKVDCGQPVLPTTTALPKCRPSHRQHPILAQAGIYDKPLTCKYDGKWSRSLPECKPVCGVSKGGVTVTPTVVHGVETSLGAFPWHVGIYYPSDEEEGDWDCVCGGSLITNRIVLTAAHCVAQRNPSDVRVALGKINRSWSFNETYAVRRDIVRITYPSEYSGGINSFSWDIALVLLNQTVQFNSFVMPVCRDSSIAHSLPANITGYIVGWGRTSANGEASELLLHNNLNIVDSTVCRRMINRILSFDKICGVKGEESIAEKGDSGGGLTVVFNDLHYVYGVVSTKHNEVSVFTNISWETHRNWMDREIDNLNLYSEYNK